LGCAMKFFLSLPSKVTRPTVSTSPLHRMRT
jgi:hypothetical protein